MSRTSLLSAWCLFVSVPLAHAGGRECQLHDWAKGAVSADPEVRAPAIAALRDAGPDGLAALIHSDTALLENGRESLPRSEDAPLDPAWQRLTAALDAVARARDTYAAGLYWYTDWDKAAAAAKASGKPILSLRLLGNLDDEYSCANSRFFRTALYANAEVSRHLREHYVLHWKSVRPVPRVTIDFGDGRELHRTLTGNSIHYVLDAEGRVIDALPGLYGPGAFLDTLKGAEQVIQPAARAPAAERESMLRRFHTTRVSMLTSSWNSDLQQIGAVIPLTSGDQADETEAQRAMRRTASKMRVEAPLLRASVPTAKALEEATDDSAWSRIAALRGGEARLDDASLRFMREKSAILRRETEFQLVSANEPACIAEAGMAERFMERIALDTVRNEYLYRRAIHQWLASDGSSPDVEALNARVYAELFLTPDSDPWLGLLPGDVYSGLANDGVAHAGHSDRAALE